MIVNVTLINNNVIINAFKNVKKSYKKRKEKTEEDLILTTKVVFSMKTLNLQAFRNIHMIGKERKKMSVELFFAPHHLKLFKAFLFVVLDS
jgi:hypothetical protein